MARLEEGTPEPGLQPEVLGPGHPTLQAPDLGGRRQARYQGENEGPLPGRDPCRANGPYLGCRPDLIGSGQGAKDQERAGGHRLCLRHPPEERREAMPGALVCGDGCQPEVELRHG